MSVAERTAVSPSARAVRLARVREIASAYVALTKPRIMLFLLFTAYSAMIVAHRGLPDIQSTIVCLIGLALSSGGSAAVNMWYDRDIDAVMSRTAERPLPSGLVKPWHALALGLTLGVLSVLVFWVFDDPLAAVFSAVGYVYYAVVYTMWLKRRTPQNIVIGGGAGAFPPLVGWAAATGHQSAAAWVMFAVIFLWTPPHFWALALYKNKDYVRAGIPMMPVVRGAVVTKVQMFVYAMLLLAASVLLAPSVRHPIVFVASALVFGFVFLSSTWRLLRTSAVDAEAKQAKRTFLQSLMYLPAVFGAAVLCTLL
ncbi:heme o synthase [Alicyclobacillus acidiphilus]|uniref:heme o synthase n=1 Tax=Alicyclobacillus acidiphilus TaxID=182455 RepID=UPI0009F90EDF|nr:heme o synthase [Alicyclobacillus acidiphilus]